MLWQVLIEFVFRLAFGLTAAMAVTSARDVTSGFFRVHLWVGLGLNTFSAAVVATMPTQLPQSRPLLGISILAATLSYVGSILWLYEKATPGRWVLWFVTAVNLAGACFASASGESSPPFWAITLDSLSSGLLLGFTFSAMLLGHWYLNTPSMKMAPLQRLIILIGVAVLFRAVLGASGILLGIAPGQLQSQAFLSFLALRWLAGLIGLAVLAWMSWQTLKIPNTQSATGILYVAVIFAFLGELTSQLLSAQTPFPL